MKNVKICTLLCFALVLASAFSLLAIPAMAEDQEALVWPSETETAGEVKATRTYTLQNAMDSVVTELYVYPSAGTDKGENLAGDGLVRGEQVYVTVTGYMLHTENETLYTVEFVADGQT